MKPLECITGGAWGEAAGPCWDPIVEHLGPHEGWTRWFSELPPHPYRLMWGQGGQIRIPQALPSGRQLAWLGCSGCPLPQSPLLTALLWPGMSHRAQGSCAARPVLPGPMSDHKVQGQTCSLGAGWRAKMQMRGARWGAGRTDRWQQGLACTSRGAVWLLGRSSLLRGLRIVHCPHGLDPLTLLLFSCLVLLCPSVLSRNDTSSKKPSVIATEIHPLSLPLRVCPLAQLLLSVGICWFMNFGPGLSVLLYYRFCVVGHCGLILSCVPSAQ